MSTRTPYCACLLSNDVLCFFFFQAEDGIRDIGVTGVQTCALPISLEHSDVDAILAGLHGIVVPGGFGARGLEGKILAAQLARERGVPYLGLCLGMQMMVIEFARHVLGWHDAHSTEVDPETGHPVISLLSEQRGVEQMGGTMRLGAYPCRLRPGTRAADAYGVENISERHRHRY